MSERQNILGRIREALASPAPVAGSHHGSGPATASESAAATHIREWLPLVGDSIESRITHFTRASADLKTDFRIFDSEAALKEAFATMAKDWKKIAAHRGELTDALFAGLDLPVWHTDGGYDVAELESSDVGVSECDALVAQTGSVLVTSRSAGGRALTVLPPHHVVIARRDQLLADLPAAFELLAQRYASDYPSFVSFITGPSRTGDIERILVLGAHGPKQLTVLCY